MIAASAVQAGEQATAEVSVNDEWKDRKRDER